MGSLGSVPRSVAVGCEPLATRRGRKWPEAPATVCDAHTLSSRADPHFSSWFPEMGTWAPSFHRPGCKSPASRKHGGSSLCLFPLSGEEGSWLSGPARPDTRVPAWFPWRNPLVPPRPPAVTQPQVSTHYLGTRALHSQPVMLS